MHDLVIRGGTIIDGTGAPGFVGDLAIDKGVIVAVDGDIGPGNREIEARGNIVTPGFVDTHTHYDGQVTWDAQLSPAAWHGVTTAIMGNCGMGFAPVRPGIEARDYPRRQIDGTRRRGVSGPANDPCQLRSIHCGYCCQPWTVPDPARQAGSNGLPRARHRHRHRRGQAASHSHRADPAGHRPATSLG